MSLTEEQLNASKKQPKPKKSKLKKPANVSLRQKRALLLGIMLLIGAVLLAFVFLTPDKVLTVSVEPIEAGVETILGTTIKMGESVWLYSDAAKLEISHPGYRNATVDLALVGGPTEFLVELVPLPGYLDILLQGDLAVDVLINDIKAELLTAIELEAGIHSVVLEYQGIFLTSESVEVAGFGEEYLLEFDLTHYQSSLRLTVEPATAEIFLDEQPPVTGFYDGGIPIGTHHIDINHPWYQSAQLDFSTKVGDQVDLGIVKLVPKPIKAAITTEPKGASILVDHQFIGDSDMDFELLPNQGYEVRVFKPGYAEREMILRPQIGQPISKHIDFVQNSISVSVEIRPEGTIYVNGLEKGVAPQTFAAYPGDEIEARRQGLVTESVILDLAQGVDQKFVFDLYDEQEYAYRNAPQRLKIQGDLVLQKFPSLQYRQLIAQNPTQYSTVDINRPFYLSSTEVTVKAYKLFKQTSQQDERNPVTRVTWLDAIRFCNWLSRENKLQEVYRLRPSGLLAQINSASLGFRLPTEVEWEAAASLDWRTGQTNNPYEWGSKNEIPIAFANLAGRERAKVSSSYMESHADNHEKIANVASYLPNQNGLYDMTGNVSEWVHDSFDIRRKTNLPASYFDTSTEMGRTIKGSNFTTDSLEEMKIHYRDFEEVNRETLGFRVARWIR